MSFKDQLIVSSENEKIKAIQTLTLWNLRVLQFKYNIEKQHKTPTIDAQPDITPID